VIALRRAASTSEMVLIFDLGISLSMAMIRGAALARPATECGAVIVVRFERDLQLANQAGLSGFLLRLCFYRAGVSGGEPPARVL
jgi:hypothetical protein